MSSVLLFRRPCSQYSLFVCSSLPSFNVCKDCCISRVCAALACRFSQSVLKICSLRTVGAAKQQLPGIKESQLQESFVSGVQSRKPSSCCFRGGHAAPVSLCPHKCGVLRKAHSGYKYQAALNIRSSDKEVDIN